MPFPVPATTIYGAWTQVSEGSADIETRLTQRGINLREAPFNAKGDGVTDDSAAVTAWLAAGAGKRCIIPPANTGQFYKVTTSFLVPSNITIEGCGLSGEIRQTAAETRLFNLSTVSNVTFLNVAIYGQGGYSNAWVDDNHFDVGITTNGGSNLRVINCTIRNFALAGIYTLNTTDVLIQANKVMGTHTLGVVINAGSDHQYGIAVTDSVPTSHVRIIGNDVSGSAFGIDTAGAPNLLNSVIANNNVHDIPGQHAMYLGTTKLIVIGNLVTEFANHGIKVYAGTISTQRDVVVSGNYVSSSIANGFGIVIALAATGVMSDITCIGNQIRNVSATPTVNGLAGGILVEGAINVVIAHNNIRGVYTIGISVDSTQLVTDVAIDGNMIVSPTQDGININAPAGSARLRITGNRLSAIPAGFMGIKLASVVDDVFIEGNTVIGGFNSVYNGGASTNVKIVNNKFAGYASEPFPLSSVPVIYENNQDGKEFTTYAATSAMVDYDRYVGVNCVAAVTLTVPTAAAGNRGRQITFIKTDASGNAATLSCAASNINGAASQALAAQFNKMTIRSNGVTWFIVG